MEQSVAIVEPPEQVCDDPAARAKQRARLRELLHERARERGASIDAEALAEVRRIAATWPA